MEPKNSLIYTVRLPPKNLCDGRHPGVLDAYEAPPMTQHMWGGENTDFCQASPAPDIKIRPRVLIEVLAENPSLITTRFVPTNILNTCSITITMSHEELVEISSRFTNFS